MKCSFFLKSTVFSEAPAFRISQCDYCKIQVQWVEYGEDSANTQNTNFFLPATSVNDGWLGNYGTTYKYPNPIKSVGSSITGISPTDWAISHEYTVSQSAPGDLGNMVYFPYLAGPFLDTQTATVKWSRI